MANKKVIAVVGATGAQGGGVVRAILNDKDAGVGHAIWSTFEDTRQWVPLDDDRMPTLMGKYKVAHFDANRWPSR